MLGRVTFVTAAAGAALVLGATAASAHGCSNVSRPPPPCHATSTCAPFTMVGQWLWLPSIPGAGLPPVWGFENGLLLGNSAICSTDGVPARQTDHGIQTRC